MGLSFNLDDIEGIRDMKYYLGQVEEQIKGYKTSATVLIKADSPIAQEYVNTTSLGYIKEITEETFYELEAKLTLALLRHKTRDYKSHG